MGVKESYDASAETYDAYRRKLVPHFDIYYEAVAEVLRGYGKTSGSVLDLGCGTGLLATRLATSFPDMEFTLVDLSGEMLEKAKERFAREGLAADFEVKDYASEELEGSYDVIVSAVSIHHIPDEAKRALFRKVRSVLVPGGLFVNADQVLGATATIDELYRENWLSYVMASGMTEEALAPVFQRMKEDKLAPLNEQLQWLRDTGFEDVNCWYKHFSLAVYSGRKPVE